MKNLTSLRIVFKTCPPDLILSHICSLSYLFLMDKEPVVIRDIMSIC